MSIAWNEFYNWHPDRPGSGQASREFDKPINPGVVSLRDESLRDLGRSTTAGNVLSKPSQIMGVATNGMVCLAT
jgi:hypothetical protein